MTDRIRTASDVPFREAGIGMACKWSCMGCQQWRYTTMGARGVGIRRRCAECVRKRAEAAA